ncbi:MAG: 1-phosphofructokinase, partial [Clostridiaceae bacterium]|nr:1-phosphofructokinase [Clostridiaceae bacterium]
MQGYTLKEIARLATASGSVTASKEGSNVCSLDEVKEKLSLVQLKKL